jgi:hypothetical protein
MIKGQAYNLRFVILVGVRLHVPDDLVGKELGELGRLEDVPLNIAQSVISERLDNLWDVEERHINRMAFQSPHGVLDQIRVVPVGWQEKGHRCYGVHRGPEEQVLMAAWLRDDTQMRRAAWWNEP